MVRILKNQHGLGIVEILICLGILVVSLGVAFAAWNKSIKPTALLNNAVRSVYSDIQNARLEAISKNVCCGIAFYINPDRYITFIDTNSNSRYDSKDRKLKTVNLSTSYPDVGLDRTKGEGDGVTFPNNLLVIFPHAAATVGGKVFLKNTNGEGRKITVAITGVTSIAPY